MQKRSGWLSVLVVALAMASTARADEACRAVEIQPLPGDDGVVVTGLNDFGQVTGWSYRQGGTTSTAFVWSYGRHRVLEPLTADQHALPHALNDLGQVVGQAASVSGFVPVIWTHGGVELLAGNPGDRPTAINNRGQIVGTREGSCLYGRNRHSEPVEFGQQGGTFCTAEAINEHGAVAGFGNAASGLWHAFIWRDGVFTPVGSLPMPEQPYQSDGSALYDINGRGLAVGWASPYGDLLLYGGENGARLLLGNRGRRAVAINAWSTIFVVGADESELLLFNTSGQARSKGALRGGVNGQELFANDLYQLAWWGRDNKAYFCQLTW